MLPSNTLRFIKRVTYKQNNMYVANGEAFKMVIPWEMNNL